MNLSREKKLNLHGYATNNVQRQEWEPRVIEDLVRKGGEPCSGSQVSPVTAINELTLGFRAVWYAPIYYVRYNLQRELIKASVFWTFKLRVDNILERIFKKSVLHWEETELYNMFHPYTFLLFNKILNNGGGGIIQNSFYLHIYRVFFLKDNYTSTTNKSENITFIIALQF